MVKEMGRGRGIVSSGVVDGGGLKTISVEVVVEVVGIGGRSGVRIGGRGVDRGGDVGGVAR